MDPLSITSTVIGLTATCLQTAKALNDIKDKYQNAQFTISAIVTEATIISASLSRIQTLMLGNADDVSEKLKRPDLETTLDAALTGCYVVFDVLEAEVRKLTEASSSQEGGIGTMAKIRFVWSESTMQDILGQIRGLQTALTLLLQLLATDSMAELRTMMDRNTAVLARVVQKTTQFRTSRESRAPGSIFEMSFMTQSIKTGDDASLISSTFFTFDDELVNAPAYRRTLAKAYAALKEENEQGGKQQTDSGDAATIIDEGKQSRLAAPEVEIKNDKTSMTDSSSGTLAAAASTITDSLQKLTTNETPVLTATPTASFEAFIGGSDYERKQLEDWYILWELKTDDIKGKDKEEINRQAMLREVVISEIHYMRSLCVLKYLYRQRWMLGPDFSVDNPSTLFPDCADIYHANRTLLLDPMLSRESSEGPWVSGYWDIFHNWLKQSANFYVQYTEQLPLIEHRIKKAAENARFSQFLEQGRQNPRSNKLDWNSYLKSPIIRFQRYTLLLGAIRKTSSRMANFPSDQLSSLDKLMEELKHVGRQCDNVFELSSDRLQVVKLRASCDQIWGPRTVPEGSHIQYWAKGELRESKFSPRASISGGDIVIIDTPKPILFILSSKIQQRWLGEGVSVSIQFPSSSGEALQVQIDTPKWRIWFMVDTPQKAQRLKQEIHHAFRPATHLFPR